MNKLIAFFLLSFVGAAMLSGVLEGGGGLAATELNAAMTETSTSCNVNSTEGFLGSPGFLGTADIIVIGGEKILYASCNATAFTFAVNGRGYDGTAPDIHNSGDAVYTTSASAVNNALGFNIAATVDAMGMWSVVTIPFYFFTKTVPQLIMWNFAMFKGDLAILSFFFFAFGAAFVITLALMLAGVRRV